ncbi:MAG: ribosome maturation factor RimM [Tatlockia sp.]
MVKNTDWIVVGRFGRAHGIKGFVTVHSYTEPRENILRYADWHGFIDSQWKPIKVLHLEVNNKSILVQVDGYQEREQAARLTHIDIAMTRSQLPVLPAGEYYWHDLIGMQVIDPNGALFGTVTEIMPTGSNDVLIVEGEKKHLIPYIMDQVVLSIDPQQRIITVDWDMDF